MSLFLELRLGKIVNNLGEARYQPYLYLSCPSFESIHTFISEFRLRALMIFSRGERTNYFHASRQHKASLAICLVSAILRQYPALDYELIQLYTVMC